MARGTAPTPAQPVQITHGGKTYSGSYTIGGKTVTVAYLGRTKTAPLGGSETAPDNLARKLLRQLVDASGVKG
jgi:hypothetical protein